MVFLWNMKLTKKFNIQDRKQIEEEMGIGVYNEHCRSIVMKYSGEWQTIVTRTGRWIDFKNDYKTMNLSFMESVWWVFKQLWDKNLVYRGKKVMPYSVACSTPLSNFEAGQDYQDVSDPAITIAFKVPGQDYELVAWTTTPWTLPSNLCLAVHPEMIYVKVLDTTSKRKFILMKDRLCQLFNLKNKKSYEILEEFPGSKLVGIEYEPLFPFFTSWKEHGPCTLR